MNCSWTPSSDGKSIVRELDQVEKCFRDLERLGQVNSLHCFDVVGCIKVKARKRPDDVAKQAEIAWRKFAAANPALTCEIADQHVVHRRYDQEDYSTLLERTFIVDHDSSQAEHLIKRLNSTRKPTLYYITRSNEFVVHASHAQIDGLGLASFFSDFLRLLAGAKAEDGTHIPLQNQTARLPEGLGSAFFRPHASKQGFLDSQIEGKSGSDYDGNQRKPNSCVQIKRCFSETGTLVLKTLSFSLTETKGILERARHLKVSVTHFLHTAFAMSMPSKSHPEQKVNYKAVLPFNLRHHWAGPPETGSKAFALRLGLGLVDTQLLSFRESLENMKECYKTTLIGDPAITTNEVIHKISSTAEATDELLSNVFSSPGDVSPLFQESYDDVDLEDFWVVAAPVIPCVFASACTLFGKLSLRICYYSGFYDDYDIDLFMERIRRTIHEQGVDMRT